MMLTISQSVGINGVNTPIDVKSVQRALNALGSSPQSDVDGSLGSHPELSNTVAAIKHFQRAVVAMRTPDGRIDVNGRTHKCINEKMQESVPSPMYTLPPVQHAQPINDADFIHIATLLGCEVATIKAVAKVESASGAFLPDGRPKILFEAHIFSKHTQHAFDHSHPSISCATWNKQLYVGGEGEYQRLNLAMTLDADAALSSASWGMFQIMGFNYLACGYPHVRAFVAAMFASQLAHLQAFAAFLQSQHLDTLLQAKDWRAFAAGYNGPSYAQNKYDEKLANAYKQFT
ncbi:N-acetylmuramidase domain-containing protein [Pseudoalteromonas sp. SSDWG2]|uniref:N-acetylmuramidase domain-containing protein n=1 Tax=Pseudoalteromonas sp. SSDWG2 TaxID=3139391 RepID=UPI003BA87881